MTGPDVGPGLVVVLEGLEGTGKTTVARECAARLSALSLTATVVPEFTASPLGSYLASRLVTDRFLRDPANTPSAWTQVLSVAADLAYAVEYVVPGAARSHAVVLKDRWHESVVACQHVALADEYGLDDVTAATMIENLVRPVPDPAHLKIWLQAPEPIRLRRLRDRDDYHPDDLPTLRRRAEAYRRLLDDPDRRREFVFVDSSPDLDAVVDTVLKLVLSRRRAELGPAAAPAPPVRQV